MENKELEESGTLYEEIEKNRGNIDWKRSNELMKSIDIEISQKFKKKDKKYWCAFYKKFIDILNR